MIVPRTLVSLVVEANGKVWQGSQEEPLVDRQQ